MINNNIFKKGSVLFLCCLLIFSGFSTAPLTIVQAEEAETVKEDIDVEDMVPLFANRVKNPEIKYYGSSGTRISIENWKVTASDNVMGTGGETDGMELLAHASGGNWRGLVEGGSNTFSHYKLFKHNEGDDEVFRGIAGAVDANNQEYDGKHVYEEGWAFYSLSQTVELDEGEDYIFRMDYDTDSEANFLVRVYPGELSSGDGYLETEEGYEHVTTVTKSDGIQHLEIDLSAAKNEDGKATVAIRHIPKKGENGEFHIYRVGFFLKADYDLQDKVAELFEDSDEETLPYNGKTYTEAVNNMQGIIDEIENKLNDGKGYHNDVKKHVGEALTKAKNMLKSIEDIKQTIEDTFEDRPVSEEKVKELKDQIEAISSENFKKDLQDLLDLEKLKEEILLEIDEKQVTDEALT